MANVRTYRHLSCLVACVLLPLLQEGCNARDRKAEPTPRIGVSEDADEGKGGRLAPTFDETLLAHVQRTLDLYADAYVAEREAVLAIGDKKQGLRLAEVAQHHGDPYVRIISGAWQVRVQNPGLVQRMTDTLAYLDSSRMLHASMQELPPRPSVREAFGPLLQDRSGCVLVIELYLKTECDYKNFILGRLTNIMGDPETGVKPLGAPMAFVDLASIYVAGRLTDRGGLGLACSVAMQWERSTFARDANPLVSLLVSRLQHEIAAGTEANPHPLGDHNPTGVPYTMTAAAILNALEHTVTSEYAEILNQLAQETRIPKVREWLLRIIGKIPQLEKRKAEWRRRLEAIERSKERF